MSLILSGDTGVPVTTVTGTLPVANGGSGVTTSTGSGANVLGTSPTLATPVFDSATFATVSGTAPLYGCRAWCTFNGTTAGTNAPTAGGNVSTVTRNGTGDYTVNFTTAMPDANYASVFGWGMTNATVTLLIGTATLIAPTTSALRFAMINSSTGAGLDVVRISVSIFR
jgi:hypothetical protein